MNVNLNTEREPYLVEIGDAATWFDHILLHYKATGQVMACSWTWLQPNNKHGGDKQCRSGAFQWEYEALA